MRPLTSARSTRRSPPSRRRQARRRHRHGRRQGRARSGSWSPLEYRRRADRARPRPSRRSPGSRLPRPSPAHPRHRPPPRGRATPDHPRDSAAPARSAARAPRRGGGSAPPSRRPNAGCRTAPAAPAAGPATGHVHAKRPLGGRGRPRERRQDDEVLNEHVLDHGQGDGPGEQQGGDGEAGGSHRPRATKRHPGHGHRAGNAGQGEQREREPDDEGDHGPGQEPPRRTSAAPAQARWAVVGRAGVTVRGWRRPARASSPRWGDAQPHLPEAGTPQGVTSPPFQRHGRIIAAPLTPWNGVLRNRTHTREVFSVS